MASAAAGSAPASSSLAALLRRTRLSTFDPTISQVYTAPPAYASRGDWGLKRGLPSGAASQGGSSNLRFVDVKALDTPEGQTVWIEREKETLFVKRWNETGARLDVGRKSNDVHSIPEIEPGELGPRPRTIFDPSTRRQLPSEFVEPPPPQPLEGNTEVTAAQKDEWEAHVRWVHRLRALAREGLKVEHGYGAQGVVGGAKDAFGEKQSHFTTSPDMMPNYHIMSDRQFERYLDQIRAARPALKARLERNAHQKLLQDLREDEHKRRRNAEDAVAAARERGEESSLVEEMPQNVPAHPEPTDMWDESRSARAMTPTRFLQSRVAALSSNPQSQQLPGAFQPATAHPHAGLQYSQPDQIYTQRLAPALPGRVLHVINPRQLKRNVRGSVVPQSSAVAVGGSIASMKRSEGEGLTPIDYLRQDPKRGTSTFRILNAYRTAALPGNPSSVDGLAPPELGYVVAAVRASAEADATRFTPGLPGSREWVGARDESRSATGRSPAYDFANRAAAPGGHRSAGPGSMYSWMYGDREVRRANNLRQRPHRQPREGMMKAQSAPGEGEQHAAQSGARAMLGRLTARIQKGQGQGDK